MEQNVKIQDLIVKIESQKLKSKIDTTSITNFLNNYEENKPIPIIFYTKKLEEIKNKKLLCLNCKRIATYKYNDNIYCWIHAHSLI